RDGPGELREPRGRPGTGRRARRRSGQPRSRGRAARRREDVLPHALPHRKGEMLWTSARLRRPRDVEIQERVAAARRHAPESEAWLGLLEAALAESEAGDVSTSPRLAAERPIKAPLLARATVTVDERAAE